MWKGEAAKKMAEEGDAIDNEMWTENELLTLLAKALYLAPDHKTRCQIIETNYLKNPDRIVRGGNTATSETRYLPPELGGEPLAYRRMLGWQFDERVLDLAAEKARIAPDERVRFCEGVALSLIDEHWRWEVRGKHERPDPAIVNAAKAIRAARAAILALNDDQLASTRLAIFAEQPRWLETMIVRREIKGEEDINILLDALEAWDNAFGRMLGRSVKQEVTATARPKGATANVYLREVICEIWGHAADCGGKLTLSKKVGGGAAGTIAEVLQTLYPVLPPDIRQRQYRYSMLAAIQRHVNSQFTQT